jgi:hypothetical protein
LIEPANRSERSGEADDFAEDLDPSISGAERRELLSLSQHLRQKRPIPRPGMRSGIRAQLLSESARPMARSRVARLVFGYAASGALLLVVAAAGLVGIGPFAA